MLLLGYGEFGGQSHRTYGRERERQLQRPRSPSPSLHIIRHIIGRSSSGSLTWWHISMLIASTTHTRIITPPKNTICSSLL